MENQSTYEVKADYAFAKTYSLTMVQVAKVTDLAIRLGMNPSEVVRKAIDELYDKHTVNADDC